jgi:hypothetical protein
MDDNWLHADTALVNSKKLRVAHEAMLAVKKRVEDGFYDATLHLGHVRCDLDRQVFNLVQSLDPTGRYIFDALGLICEGKGEGVSALKEILERTEEENVHRVGGKSRRR